MVSPSGSAEEESKAPRRSRAPATGRALPLALALAAATAVDAFSVRPSRQQTALRIRPPRAAASSESALGVASFPKREKSGGALDLDEEDVDASVEDLRRQADELEELLRHTSPSSFALSPRADEDRDGAAIGTLDPFDVESRGGVAVPAAAAAAVVAAEATQTERPPAAGGWMGLDPVWSARLLVIVAAALYGTNFSVVKILDETGMPVGVSSTLRFAMAAFATLPWLLAPAVSKEEADEDESVEGPDGSAKAKLEETGASESLGGIRSWWDSIQSNAALAAGVAGFEVGLWNSIGYIAQAVGLETTEAGKSAFICSLAVVIVPVLDFFAGKKFLPRELVGAAMAVAGVGLLEFGPGDGGGLHRLSSGDVASLIQPLAFGMGFWRMEDAMHKHGEEATRATAGQMLAVFLASAAYCAVSASGVIGSGAPLPPAEQILGWLADPSIVSALLWTGVITTALTVYMETLALRTLSAAETTMIFSTEPLWGAAFAAAVLGERFGPEAGAGAALILAGIAYSNVGLDWLSGKKEEEGGEGEGEGEGATATSSEGAAAEKAPTSAAS